MSNSKFSIIGDIAKEANKSNIKEKNKTLDAEIEKHRSKEVEKLGSKEVEKLGSEEVEKQRSEEVKNYRSKEVEKHGTEETEEQRSEEVKKHRSEEAKKARGRESKSGYYIYRTYPVSKSKQADKYKVNFSLNEDIVQKIQYIQSVEGVSIREYSKIAELAINLLYDIKYHTNERLIDKDSGEILKLIGIELEK